MKDSAERAIRGALREQGKLLLCLSQTEFAAMMLGFDDGNGPAEILFAKRDELLMSLAR